MPRVSEGRPVIVCSNHPGWWDPALLILLQDTTMPERIGFGPMDEAALNRYAVLRKMGIFGIDPASRAGAAAFLQNGLRILSDPRAVLWVTAEGTFTDARIRPVRLRAGIAHLARRVPQAIVLPLALEYVFWNERFPVALAHFGAPLQADPARNVAGWTSMLEQSLEAAMNALATESLSRDPARFHQLLRGRAGVGGIYDLWRHAIAVARGRRFDAHHEQNR